MGDFGAQVHLRMDRSYVKIRVAQIFRTLEVAIVSSYSHLKVSRIFAVNVEDGPRAVLR